MLTLRPTSWDAPHYRVKLFRPPGAYPKGTFCSPTGIFHADDAIVFSVTCGGPWPYKDNVPYSEVDWLWPEEVRLLGAMMLTERFPEGLRCRFYPVARGGFVVDKANLQLTETATALAIRKELLKASESSTWPRHVSEMWRVCLGKEFYNFEPSELNADLFIAYWQRLSTSNHVLMRALQALIKSDMLAAHDEFLEEATIATFIAMDASFTLVLRHLEGLGIHNPSAKDAGDWMYREFDEPMGVHGADGLKYFEEFYSQRIQTVHPGSRLGDVPYAPVMADDYIHLRQALPGVLAYLILEEHPPHFWKEVAERKARWDTPAPPCSSC